MISTLEKLPLFVILMLLMSALMMVPALHAARLDEWDVARTFLYHGIFFAILATMLGIGTAKAKVAHRPIAQLLSLLLAYLVLPVMMALPVEYLVPSITLAQGYFEMLSSFTTTGATIFSEPDTISEPIHLWRATVAWAGGLMMLVAAFAVLEPLQLGGFELEESLGDTGIKKRSGAGGAAHPNQRIIRYTRLIAPPYILLTIALSIGLIMAGDRSFVALCHAMSTLATSGISPLSSFGETSSGRIGEVLLFLFLFLAISHRGISISLRGNLLRRRGMNPEYKIALACLIFIPTLLFVRHFAASFDIAEQQNFSAAMRALWGSIFNTLSFLTTTGFISQDWEAARFWSGLNSPGLVLLALCVMGGGVATTAGGVKLLRVYALYKHGRREMGRLIHPNSVGGAGITARRFRREGARIAWIFMMLFILGIAATMLALTAAGQGFDDATALSIAALTNTGPAAYLLESHIEFANFNNVTRTILCIAMIIGRLETLVVYALFNPGLWR